MVVEECTIKFIYIRLYRPGKLDQLARRKRLMLDQLKEGFERFGATTCEITGL